MKASDSAVERPVPGQLRTRDIRHWLQETVDRWDRSDIADVACLIVTELVVNARRHGAPPVAVRAAPTDDGVRIEVSDGGGGKPRVVDPGVGASGGRGLLLVEAMAERWGWEPDGTGKVVWAEVAPSVD